MKTFEAIGSRRRWTDRETRSALLCFTLESSVNSDLLSVSETMACLWPLPIIVSSRQSPMRERVSTMAGRSSIDLRLTNLGNWWNHNVYDVVFYSADTGRDCPLVVCF